MDHLDETKPQLGETPSWYLDPLVAGQKRAVHENWIRRSVGNRPHAVVLKTDLFEEAYGLDRLLFGLFPDASRVIGVDVEFRTVRAASARGGPGFVCAAADVLRLPFPADSVDVIVSTSTLDHFASGEELGKAIGELARVLRPGGIVLMTLDNPRNPLYHVLRWCSRRGWTPFELGHTASRAALVRSLKGNGFTVESTEYLIHNPRLISTVLFLALRKVFGRYAELPVRALLKLFSLCGHLPTRSVTGCFVGACGVKTGSQPAPGRVSRMRPSPRSW